MQNLIEMSLMAYAIMGLFGVQAAVSMLGEFWDVTTKWYLLLMCIIHLLFVCTGISIILIKLV